MERWSGRCGLMAWSYVRGRSGDENWMDKGDVCKLCLMTTSTCLQLALRWSLIIFILIHPVWAGLTYAAVSLSTRQNDR